MKEVVDLVQRSPMYHYYVALRKAVQLDTNELRMLIPLEAYEDNLSRINFETIWSQF